MELPAESYSVKSHLDVKTSSQLPSEYLGTGYPSDDAPLSKDALATAVILYCGLPSYGTEAAKSPSFPLHRCRCRDWGEGGGEGAVTCMVHLSPCTHQHSTYFSGNHSEVTLTERQSFFDCFQPTKQILNSSMTKSFTLK